MFEFLIKKLKAHPRRIVFTEGTDPRILEASARLLSGTFLTPVLVGNPDAIQAAAEEAGFNIRGAEIIDPEAFDDMEKMVTLLVELRKGKMTEEECRKLLKQPNYFGTMLVKMGYADALLGGATYSTADTVRPALQIIKTKPATRSSPPASFWSAPPASARTRSWPWATAPSTSSPPRTSWWRSAWRPPRPPRSSASTPRWPTSATPPWAPARARTWTRCATPATSSRPWPPIWTWTASCSSTPPSPPRVAHTKCPNSKVAGHANTFIFPDINAGNIGYKIAQRLGSFDAYGPILQGLNAPINDLSRGCNALEVYSMAIITAGLCED